MGRIVIKRNVYSAGIGALLARALPMAALAGPWGFAAIFGNLPGCALSVLMLCAFCAMLFLLESDGGAGRRRKAECSEGLCLAVYAAQTAMLPGFTHAPGPVAHGLAVCADCAVIILSVILSSPWYHHGERRRFILYKLAAWVALFAAAIWLLPGALSAMGTTAADRAQAAAATMAAAGLIYTAISRIRTAPCALSWPGVLFGMAFILLIDIVI